jgi:hypothetical protein
MMIKKLVVGLVLILSIGACGRAWVDFCSEEGRFAVALPGSPEKKTTTVDRVQSQVQVRSFSLASTPQNPLAQLGEDLWFHPRFYYVSYMDINKEQWPGKESALDQEMRLLVAQLTGTRLSERRISLGTFEGKEVQVETASGFSTRIRLYLVDDRLYRVSVGGEKHQVNSSLADRFLDSFRLARKCDS